MALGEVPLGPGREALVQPDVGPALEADRVAEPLVGGLVDDRGAVGRERVDRPRLRLQRVLEVGDVDHRAGRGERIGPVDVGLPADDLRQRVDRRPRLLHQPRVDQRPGRQLADVPLDELAVADVDEGQVGRHRRRFRPRPANPSVELLPRDQPAVGHRLQPGRDGDLDVEARLVARRVVAGQPGGRADRLADRDRAVAGPVPALGRAVGIGDLARHAPGSGASTLNASPLAIGVAGTIFTLPLAAAVLRPLRRRLRPRSPSARRGRARSG